ncbi:fusarubin cluster-transcription factor [Fusarium sporotrichioides]|uniref:Fusarubin cluster-transcription factor n=1 Tax=Fusarium sporotrichioides TaxID=5514 RepID=A0A395SWM8_FUSSP|nr:fusarubin cluster-transcription factor [Fusarium sporotrichioides]
MSDGYRLFSELHIPSSARSAKPVRLRLACDACTTAKVRCSRTHPCERCEDNGQERECYYSESRRHGKRARHRKITEARTQRSSSSSNTATSPSVHDAVGNGFEDISISDSAWDYRASACSVLTGFETLDGWKSHIDVPIDFDGLNSIPWVDPWTSLGFELDTSPSESSGIMTPDPLLSIKPANPPIATKMYAFSQSHGCEETALRLLRSLHCNDQTTEFCKQAHGNQSSHPVPSIDTVLSVNKAALANIIPLLKCACSREPHITMLHGAILSKVLFWYSVAVTDCYHTEGIVIRPIKIQLGMLDLDDEDQATLQGTVLLRELRKAEAVIETFESSYNTKGKTAGWNVSAVRNMTEELRDIMRKIKNGHGDLA